MKRMDKVDRFFLRWVIAFVAVWALLMILFLVKDKDYLAFAAMCVAPVFVIILGLRAVTWKKSSW